MLNFTHQYSIVCAYPGYFDIGRFSYRYEPSDGYIYRAFIPTFSGLGSWERYQAVSSVVLSRYGSTL